MLFLLVFCAQTIDIRVRIELFNMELFEEVKSIHITGKYDWTKITLDEEFLQVSSRENCEAIFSVI